jgi:hypothetical protein
LSPPIAFSEPDNTGDFLIHRYFFLKRIRNYFLTLTPTEAAPGDFLSPGRRVGPIQDALNLLRTISGLLINLYRIRKIIVALLVNCQSGKSSMTALPDMGLFR